MAVKTSIFGSRSEESGFRSIEHTWGQDYAVYPQVPLSALCTSDPEWTDTTNFFFKTSVDYVLCTNKGRPILAIDFDGMGRGFDREGEYVQVEPTTDRFRKRKFDIKLRFSQQNGFPYHVVSSEEFRSLGDGIDLTVVDGIVGSIIAKKQFLDLAPSFLEDRADEIETKPRWYKSEFIQELLMVLEMDCDAEHSRIFHKKCEIMDQVHSLTGAHSYPQGYRWFEEPECPNIDWPPWENQAAFQRRVEAMRRVEFWGCVATISDTPVGEVSARVRVRNVAHSLSLVMEIGELLAWSKLLHLLRRRS